MRRKYGKEHNELRKVLVLRDKGCVICGETKNMNCAHIIPFEFEKFRTDPINGIILCVNHHTFGKYSCHKNPIWFSEWLRINRPDQFLIAVERLKELEKEKSE